MTANKGTEYFVWKACKYLKHLIIQIPVVRKTDGKWVRNSDEEQTFAGSDELAELGSNIYELKINSTGHTKRVAEEIRTNLFPGKAPGLNMITETNLNNFQRKVIVKLTGLIDASIGL